MAEKDETQFLTHDQSLRELVGVESENVEREEVEALAGAGVVRVDADLMHRIAESIQARKDEIASTFPTLVKECPYETKLAIAAWVFDAIVNHAKEGGTFRYLIYTRLGFSEDAYVPLYMAGGMEISNHFELKEEGASS